MGSSRPALSRSLNALWYGDSPLRWALYPFAVV